MKMLAALLVGSLPALAGVTYCQPIVIQYSQVASVDQANYVLTVSDTDPHLATLANGGYVQTSNGDDIIFSSDSQGQNLLHWDPLEVYNPVTGQIVTHVGVGTVSHTANTTIYRCTGNAVGAFQGGAAGAAWPSSYRLVHHLGRGGALDVGDSTTNGNNGMSVGASAAPGMVGEAAGLNGTSNYIGVADSGSLEITGQLTLAAWVKFNAIPGGVYTEIIQKGSPYFLFSDGNPNLGLAIDGDYVAGADYSIPVSAVGAWSQIVGTYDSSSSTVKLYWNGTLVDTRTTANTLTADTSPLGLGALAGGGGQFLNGALDEVRISSVALSADRIATDFNNQSNPSTFYIPGAWTAMQITQTGGSQIFVF